MQFSPQPTKKRLLLARKAIIQWYEEMGRRYPWRESSNAYEILVAEMLLRRTTASAVCRVYHDFIAKFETPERLAKAREYTIARYVQSLGLQNQRARDLRDMAKLLIKEHNGKPPKSLEELEALPGVGKYISAALMNFAYKTPVPMVDGNVLHLVNRLFSLSIKEPSNSKVWDFMSEFGAEKQDKRLYWGIIDLVATTCLRKKPRCESCPLPKVCDYFRELTRAQNKQS
ncbi:MAG: hypothetical protein ACXAAP_11130 [Candidatus Thorarchaeota archaeon]|jgi:A/G-specific adenine glycosylase